MILWLHNQGYTYFTIPKLTYPEIEGLVSAKNRKVKKQIAEQKKMERKTKRNKSRGRYR